MWGMGEMLFLKIFESVHNVQIDPVEAGGEDTVQVAVALAANQILPFGIPVADFVIARPRRVLTGQPCGFVPLPRNLPIVAVILRLPY